MLFELGLVICLYFKCVSFLILNIYLSIKGRSCETQLITTTHDLLSSFNSKSQIDVAILDFSKAFDTVPHAGLYI